MCDQQCYNSCTWTSFYHHYLEQHAIMTQYFQQLNQSTSAVSSRNACQTCHCDFYNPVNAHYRPPLQERSSSESDSTSSENYATSASSSEHEVEQKDSYEINEDDDDSECEYELNVDAIIAMRAAKEELTKSSTSESESIVLVDSDKEEFEFVELGSFSTLTSKLSRGIYSDVNKREEFETHKKIMDYLYGEKSATIGGLETAMAVNFEHLCDVHQPSLWPVLPVRL